MRFWHAPGPVPGDATTGQLPPHSLASFSMALTRDPIAIGTPLALCQGMPRLTGYRDAAACFSGRRLSIKVLEKNASVKILALISIDEKLIVLRLHLIDLQTAW